MSLRSYGAKLLAGKTLSRMGCFSPHIRLTHYPIPILSLALTALFLYNLTSDIPICVNHCRIRRNIHSCARLGDN